jgi:hypothetical protein
MKSKRAEEYLDRKSPVKTVGDRKFYYPISRLEAEKAVELAEQDAEEEIEALKARTVEVFKRCCIYRSKSEDSDSCFLNDQYNTCDNNCSKVKLLIQILNEQ